MLAVRVLSDWFLEQPPVYKAILLFPVAFAVLQVVRDSL